MIVVCKVPDNRDRVFGNIYTYMLIGISFLTTVIDSWCQCIALLNILPSIVLLGVLFGFLIRYRRALIREGVVDSLVTPIIRLTILCCIRLIITMYVLPENNVFYLNSSIGPNLFNRTDSYRS